MRQPRLRVYFHQFKANELVGCAYMMFTKEQIEGAVETITACVNDPRFADHQWDRTEVYVGARRHVITRAVSAMETDLREIA